MSQLTQEQSGQDTEPLLAGDELDQRLQQTRQGSPWTDLTEMYPQANKDALEVSYQKDKQGKPRLWVKMVGRGKKHILCSQETLLRGNLGKTHRFHKKSEPISGSQWVNK